MLHSTSAAQSGSTAAQKRAGPRMATGAKSARIARLAVDCISLLPLVELPQWRHCTREVLLHQPLLSEIFAASPAIPDWQQIDPRCLAPAIASRRQRGSGSRGRYPWRHWPVRISRSRSDGFLCLAILPNLVSIYLVWRPKSRRRVNPVLDQEID